MRVEYIEEEPDKQCGWCGSGWYFWDHWEANLFGPYATQELAIDGSEYYDQWLREDEGEGPEAA